jgi:hypothetical protein
MFGRLGTICLFLALPTSASSATIEVPTAAEGYVLVTVTGPLESSDIENFRTKTSLVSKAIVSFVSDGGSLQAGIEIGTMIRLKSFVTAVPNGARCASACALAWLGGTNRFMGNGARIGFHSSSVDKSDQLSNTPVGDIGNALMGAYLNRIGLPDRAIVYITQAAPEAMTWLSLDEAMDKGIDVALLPSGEKAATSDALQGKHKPRPVVGNLRPKPPAAREIVMPASPATGQCLELGDVVRAAVRANPDISGARLMGVVDRLAPYMCPPTR